MKVVGSDRVSVGQKVEFDLTISNRGDTVARNITIVDRFDRGLKHENDTANEHAITAGIAELVPGRSSTVRISFQVIDGGTQCHEATVAADGAEAVRQRGCVTAQQAVMEIKVTSLRSRVVGETAEFSCTVKNTGDIAATNIELVLRSDPAIEPAAAERGSERLADGSILFRITRMEPGEKRTVGLNGICRVPSTRACVRAQVTADGGVNRVDEACLEILPPLGGTASPRGSAP